MRILNFATLAVLNLLSNLRHTWSYIDFIENCLRALLRHCQVQIYKHLLDDDGMDQHEPQPDDDEQQEDEEQQPMDEAMDEDMSDMEEEREYIAGGINWMSDSDEEDLSLSARATRPQPLYAFQPLRLFKLYYKHNNFPYYPNARSGHRVIASDSHLYSLGGYNPSRAQYAPRRRQCLLFQELWQYNFATNSWQNLLNEDNVNMPRELASNALAIHNNVLISHGGTGYPFGESCSNDCYVFTTAEKSMVTRLKVTGDLPTPQYGPGIVIHGDYLYTVGGTTGFDYSCDVYRLNLKTRVWENIYICRPEMRDDPEGRYRHEVVYDGRHIFVLGGGTSNSVYDLQRIPAFNLKSNRWDYFETLPDRTVTENLGFPMPRKCFSCVQHTLANGDIEAFITGGLQGDFTTYFADIWKLNLSTKKWTYIRTAQLPKPLYFHSAAHANNGCMYIFGGIEYSPKEMRRRNTLYKMWMTIPKLSEMCWDAITYYNERLSRFDRDTLLKAGIPDRFEQRLPSLPSQRYIAPAVSRRQTQSE